MSGSGTRAAAVHAALEQQKVEWRGSLYRLSRGMRDGEGVARVWQAGVSEASIEVVW
jgi:hypothetical protein